MQRNIERDKKLAEAWKTGRFKTFSSLARVYRTYPKAVERAVSRDKAPHVMITPELIKKEG